MIVNEGDTATFNVEISGNVPQGTTFSYVTWDGSGLGACDGTDYIGTKGQMTPMGQNSVQLSFPTLYDPVDWDDTWGDPIYRDFSLVVVADRSGEQIASADAAGLIRVSPQPTVSIRPDNNDDGTINQTDDWLEHLGPAMVDEEGDGPRTKVDLTAAFDQAFSGDTNWKVALEVPKGTTGLEVWNQPSGGTPLTPQPDSNDGNSTVETFAMPASGVLDENVWLST